VTGTEHVLKTDPKPFEALIDGLKTFEVRADDRGYAVGDRLILVEFDRDSLTYSGRSLTVKVTYLLRGGQYGIEPGHVVMAVTRW